MLDLAYVRANLAMVEKKLRSRGMNATVILEDFDALDQERRDAITRAEKLKAQRNLISDEIANLRRLVHDTTSQTDFTKRLKAESEALEAAAAAADDRLRELMQTLPNLPQDSVPIGPDERANAVVKVWDNGEQPRDHTPDRKSTRLNSSHANISYA